MIYLGLIDGTPYNRKQFKTLLGAVRARRDIAVSETVKLRIFRKVDDGIERFDGYDDKERAEWSKVK